MKFLVCILAILSFSNQSNAKSEQTRYAAGKIVSVTSLCPEGYLCVNEGTVVIVEHEVKCTEEMVAFEQTSEQVTLEDGTKQINLYIKMLVKSLVEEKNAYCASPITKKRNIIKMPGKYGTVILFNPDQSGIFETR